MRCTQEGEQERDKREEGKQEGVEHEERRRLPTSARAGARAGREAANAESAGAVLVGTGCRAALLPRGPNRPARLMCGRALAPPAVEKVLSAASY